MKKGMKTTIIVASIGLLLLLSACSQTQDTIELGAILMLSGDASSWGISSQQGADLAIKEINEQGGIMGKKIVMTYEDNQFDDAKEALNAFTYLTSKDIEIILGPNWSPSGLALADSV